MILDWLAASEQQGKFLGGFRAPLAVGIFALAISWLLTPFVRNLAISRGAVDDPKSDDRRVHTEPIPRWGGLALFAGVVVPLLVALPLAFPSRPFPPYLVTMLVLGAAIVIMGAMDDLYQYKARVQMIFLLAVGLLVQLWFDRVGHVQIKGLTLPLFDKHGQWHDFGWVAFPLTALYIFIVTKTADTIDGIDGLAAGIAAIAAATLSILAS